MQHTRSSGAARSQNIDMQGCIMTDPVKPASSGKLSKVPVRSSPQRDSVPSSPVVLIRHEEFVPEYIIIQAPHGSPQPSTSRQITSRSRHSGTGSRLGLGTYREEEPGPGSREHYIRTGHHGAGIHVQDYTLDTQSHMSQNIQNRASSRPSYQHRDRSRGFPDTPLDSPSSNDSCSG